MSIDRASVMHAVARQELEPDYREWLTEHDATDAEGFQVLCSFAPEESALAVFRELNEYDHPVIACTIVAEQVAMVCIGDPADTTTDDRDVFPLTNEDITIAELIRAVLAAEHEFAVEFAPDRVLIAST